MSRIPRPSPRLYRDLPITDDEKRALPKKAAETLKKENKKKKELKNVTISDAALPSTTKGSAESSKTYADRQREILNRLKKVTISNAAQPLKSNEPAVFKGSTRNRQCGTLNRSKTDPAIKIDHLSFQRNGRTTSSLAKQATNLQTNVHAVKKGEVLIGAAKLKQRLSFRNKKTASEAKALSKPEESPSNSMIKSKTGNGSNIPASLKNKTAEPLKFRYDQFHKNLNHRLSRSKTESSINIEKRNKKTNSNQIIEAKSANKAIKVKDKQVKSMEKHDDILPEFMDNHEASEVKPKFYTPQEVGHSGMKFVGKPRKKSLSLNFNMNRTIPHGTPNGEGDSSDKLPKEKPEKK